MSTAVLVIDVQRALCSGKWAVLDARRVIERINHVLGIARAASAPVIIIQHEEPGGPMAHGSEGWQVDPDVATLPSDLRVRKTACDSFHETDLQDILRARQIGKLVICGLQTEYCVDTTMRRALALGYPVTLVADAHSTMDNGVLAARQIIDHHNVTLSRLDSFGQPVAAIPAAEVRIAG